VVLELNLATTFSRVPVVSGPLDKTTVLGPPTVLCEKPEAISEQAVEDRAAALASPAPLHLRKSRRPIARLGPSLELAASIFFPSRSICSHYLPVSGRSIAEDEPVRA
jgi:hypothetical protein